MANLAETIARALDGEFLTLEEASIVAHTPISTLRWWRQIGKLKVSKPGRRVLVKRSDLMALLEAPPAPPVPRPHRPDGKFGRKAA